MTLKSTPHKTFCNATFLLSANHISVKFWRFVSNLYPHILTDFCWFILIFKNGVNFSRSTFRCTISSFEFKRPWLHRKRWVTPNSSDLNPLDYQVWGQCWSLVTSCNRSQKQFQSPKMHFRWFALPYWRKSLTTLLKTCASDCRHVCQPTVEILNI